MSKAYKLLFIGEPGAGKTTCIGALSEIAPFTTEVEYGGELARVKDTMTVAFDYGEVDLGEAGRLLLYGLPGQKRFSFMFEVVRHGLLGVVVLVDASTPRAVSGLCETIDTYLNKVRLLPCVVALNKSIDSPQALKEQCLEALRKYDLVAPIVSVDARKREDIVRIFELLFLQIEFEAGSSTSKEVQV